MNWYALHVRSHFEFRVQESLDGLDLEQFAPHQTFKSRFGKGGVARRPILPGYVFARLDLEQHHVPVLRITGVVHVIGFGPDPEAIPDCEIEALQALVASGRALRREAYEPTLGDEVEISCGLYAGYQGIVTIIRGECRLKVSIHSLRITVSAEVDAASVKPVKRVA